MLICGFYASNHVNNFTINRGLSFADTTCCIQIRWHVHVLPRYSSLDFYLPDSELLF